MKFLTQGMIAATFLAASTHTAFAQQNDVDVNIKDDAANVAVQTTDQSSDIAISVPEDGIDIGVTDQGTNVNVGGLLSGIDFGGEDSGIDFGGEDGGLDLGEGTPDVDLDLGVVKVNKSGVGVNVPGVGINIGAPISMGASFEAATLEEALEIVNQPVDLNVLFDFNSDQLTPEGEVQVEKIAEAVDGLRNRTIIEIQGHTDNVGTDAFNEDLSLRRAATVKSRLKNRYNAKQKLLISGEGESQPVASNDTDAGRQQNRRVTIINLGKP